MLRVLSSLLQFHCLLTRPCISGRIRQLHYPQMRNSTSLRQFFRQEKAATQPGQELLEHVPIGEQHSVDFLYSQIPLEVLSSSGSVSEVIVCWAERLTGDYDQNGIVDEDDVHALLPYIGRRVSYEETSRIPVADGFDDQQWKLACLDGKC